MKLKISALILLTTLLATTLFTAPDRARAEYTAQGGAQGRLLQAGEIRINTLQIDIWPEYDQPTALVIYHITLDANVNLPVDLELRIPAAAGEPNALAAGLEDNVSVLRNLVYERQVEGDWAVLRFTTSMPIVRLEYYDPNLIKKGASRNFEFIWPGDYAVTSLIFEVQQPAGARDVSLNPSLGSSVLHDDGLLYYRANLGSFSAGQEQTLSLVYQKDTNTLSVQNVPVEAAGPITTNDTGFTALNGLLPWVLGVLGVVLIAGGGIWYWQSGKSREKPKATRRRRASAAERETTTAASPAPAPTEGHIYCHQCGKRASANDRFCRTCGTRLRVE